MECGVGNARSAFPTRFKTGERRRREQVIVMGIRNTLRLSLAGYHISGLSGGGT